MVSIKTFKDGARLIVVIENCTGETAKKVNDFVLDIMGMPNDIQDVPCIVPEKPIEEKAPDIKQAEEIVPSDEKPFDEPIPTQTAMNIPVVGGSGTLANAIENKDTEAIVDLCCHSKTMDDSVRYSVMGICKNYIRQDCIKRVPDSASTREIQKFFKTYEPLIAAAEKQILESAGYATAEDFFELTDEYMQQDAYRSVLDCLIQRVSN